MYLGQQIYLKRNKLRADQHKTAAGYLEQQAYTKCVDQQEKD